MKTINEETKNKIIREFHLEQSKKGGAATKEKYGTSFYENIGAIGRAARKKKARKIGKQVAKSKK